MRLLNSSHSIRFESENLLQKVQFVREEHQPKINSKMLLEGTELLIREFKHPISSKGINITSFTNFPEEELAHYFEGRHTAKVDSLRFLDNF